MTPRQHADVVTHHDWPTARTYIDERGHQVRVSVSRFGKLYISVDGRDLWDTDGFVHDDTVHRPVCDAAIASGKDGSP